MTYVYRVIRIGTEGRTTAYTVQTEWSDEVTTTKELKRLEKRYQYWSFLVQRLEMCKTAEAT